MFFLYFMLHPNITFPWTGGKIFSLCELHAIVCFVCVIGSFFGVGRFLKMMGHFLWRYLILMISFSMLHINLEDWFACVSKYTFVIFCNSVKEQGTFIAFGKTTSFNNFFASYYNYRGIINEDVDMGQNIEEWTK